MSRSSDEEGSTKPEPPASSELATVVEIGRKTPAPLAYPLETLPTADAVGPPTASGPEPSLPDDRTGSKLGRYIIVEKAGAGGMGVVYKAYDPELDRRVALKLLSAQDTGSTLSHGASNAQSRLLREAQALARLAHPNVIAVHDVGVFEDEVFVAMEYVEGSTIKQWLAAKERSLDEILRVYQAAGRGLAAAHRAGLIHRDFKPGNVIVGDDGRVRVLDFGLARSAAFDAGVEVDNEEFDSNVGIDSSHLESLTLLGAIMGTPPYMAAEQHRGEAVDARTDQFAFCVSLYEALYGERPFRGKTQAAVKRAVIKGTIPDTPSRLDVPGWLRKLLVRGLSVEASARYPSIDALLL